MRGVHGEKLVAAFESEKLPAVDRDRVEAAIEKYDAWVRDMSGIRTAMLSQCIEEMVALLNEYKSYIDVTLIFDSPEDFLYRQKGQLKLDNTIIEEFLPILVKRSLELSVGDTGLAIGSQVPTFSSVYFESSISNPAPAGGITLKPELSGFTPIG